MWKRYGFCSKCGKCCNINNYLPSLIAINVNLDKDGWCEYYDKKTKLCKIYYDSKRPHNCKVGPTSPIQIVLIPECTYWFEFVKFG